MEGEVVEEGQASRGLILLRGRKLGLEKELECRNDEVGIVARQRSSEEGES